MNKELIKNKNKGFTLIEMMVAISIFAVVMIIVIAALLSVNSANRRAQRIRAVVDNLNYAVEDMTRKIRTGGDYYCNVVDVSGGNTNPSLKECVDGKGSMRLRAQKEGSKQFCYIYYLSGSTIKRKTGTTNTGGNCAIYSENLSSTGISGWEEGIQTIASEVKINSLKFHVIGEGGPGSSAQPIVIITLSGEYNINEGQIVAPFSLQTTVSQRSAID